MVSISRIMIFMYSTTEFPKHESKPDVDVDDYYTK